MEKIKKTLVTLGLWLGFQLVVTAVFYAISILRHIDFDTLVAPALLISDALIAVTLIAIRYCKVKDMFTLIPKDAFTISVIMALSALFVVDMLSQNLDIPIMEEIMMRRVIMTEISKATGHVWWGIIISAAIFAVIHGNPIQIVFALPAGIIFGWLYYKTGSLTVPIAIHIINNTISFFTLKYSLDFKINISTTLGATVFLVLVIITLCSIVWLNRFYSGKEEVKEQ